MQVIKVGTSSLVRPEQQTLNLSSLARICETIKALHAKGHYVIVVSSGAVGVGCQRMGLVNRPTQLAKKQALAAVGQVHLMRYYEDFLSALGLRCAQVLLTLDNLANRDQYLNARNTFTELLAYGAIPVVNENDTVAVQELRFGDNDTLSAQVATLVQADWLFLMTDVDCLYTANPKDDPSAQPIHEVEDISRLAVDTSTRGTQWGTGGMATKLTAGRIATAAGCTMVICNSSAPEAVVAVLEGQAVGTKFHPRARALRGRKRWILAVPVRGSIFMDSGAVQAVKGKHKSLFAAGITHVEGDFHTQDAVSLCDQQGMELARGLVNFSAEELQRLKGKSTQEFAQELGYNAQAEVVHRWARVRMRLRVRVRVRLEPGQLSC
ncbi:Aspartate/glutamate/uridylate kinase [Haematococcus lacustris]